MCNMSKILQSQRYWCNFFQTGSFNYGCSPFGMWGRSNSKRWTGWVYDYHILYMYIRNFSWSFKFSLSHWKNTIRRNYIGDCLVLETFQIAKKWLLQIKNITPFLQIVWHEKKNTSDYTLEYINFIHCYSCL